MEIAVAADTPIHGPNRTNHSSRAVGLTSQRLISDEAQDGLNFRLLRNQFSSGENAFRTPRHHHAFQQIRFAEKGSLNYAPDRFINEGDIAYFPKGAYYGPQVKDHGVSIAIQWGFGGEHQNGATWDRYRTQALEKLYAKGKFEEGTYIETDASGTVRRMDGVQALYEAQYELHTGEKFVVPAERYQEPILMHPAAYEYYEAGRGVEIKTLGRFFDHPGPSADVRISVIRLNEGLYSLSPGRAQLAWTLTPGLKIAERTYPEITSFYSPLGEEALISSDRPVEVYLVEFPRLEDGRTITATAAREMATA
jgi:hypothetical protein